ncbi:MAG: DUF507 family protein [Wolinella sp.]
MKLRLPHAPYVANKIAIDLVNSGYVELETSMDRINQIAQNLLEENIKREIALEERVRALLEENLEEMEFLRVDERQFFWMAKKKLAEEEGFILAREDRYSDLSHKILALLIQEKIITFDVSETIIKNVIFKAMDSYTKIYESIEDVVIEKIANYKRKIIAGTEEYEMVFEKLYEEELRKRGFL